MDERDVTLLKAIADLETGSPERLHEETGIPVSTIHYRLNNLKEDGIIENDLYDFDLEAVGLGVTVVLEVLTDYSGTHHDIGEKLADIEGVTQVYFTMGETDFMVVAHLSGREMVERLITDFERLEEVERTNSTFVVSTVADANSALQSYDLETLVEELVDE
ncbi:Lrp/AsnC family transcriptional regulator [Halorarum salinum]|uniref:Lrp/AsnC family transcriptional regulator n=1 Tax=Halorarum salinum TaxID=2743089 RepID=A0A7D5LBQ4_9EURY|nr:Lrp/AsnC family transcriptional regulator [Halobaculum salinum]QLG62770.1 Lrp/AsnC family transcriptional regulator [Halobaculum salinum]